MNSRAKFLAIFGMILLLVVMVLKAVRIDFPFNLDWILMAVGAYLVRQEKRREREQDAHEAAQSKPAKPLPQGTTHTAD